MLDGFEKAAAWSVYFAAFFAPLLLAAWIGDKLTKRFERPPPVDSREPYKEDYRGCLIGGIGALAIVVACYMALQPTLDALRQVACEGDRLYRQCMGWE